MTVPRAEYPRPQLERSDWLTLNGTWRFDFDDADIGLQAGWFNDAPLAREIVVPFAFQSALSGIHTNAFHDVVWYQRQFVVPEGWQQKRVRLHFGAVDYRAWVWVNGIFVTYHEGGHTPFSAEITHYLKRSENTIVVRVEDRSTDRHQPRGKQYWEVESASIFYTRTTGIWQSVWLEAVSDVFLEDIRLTPDIDTGGVQIASLLNGNAAGVQLEAEIRLDGAVVASHQASVEPGEQAFSRFYALDTLRLWSPENPVLYDLVIRLVHDGTTLDEVRSYFGMRKISVKNGRVCLNNQPYYMRLVLDQGYHPQGILTFPTDADYQTDIQLTKALGFNGVRKHQKVEDPRYLYWADRMGLLVWGEMANCYAYSERAVQRVTAEWQQAVRRDYNHPCIVAWVPLNESWGVPELKADPRQRDHLASLYHLTKALDSTRPVISNDGWEHAHSDFLTIHDYEGKGEVLRERYHTRQNILSARPANRDLYAMGFQYQGEPILLTEFGGIAFQKHAEGGWGYTTAADEADFVRRYRDVVEAVVQSPQVQGFCYTQLTDVEQEINGLLTYDRQHKTDPETIRQITAMTPTIS